MFEIKWDQTSVVKEFNWESFIAALRDKLYPAFMTKQKPQDFINIKMRSMTISEYYDTYIKRNLQNGTALDE